MSVSPAAAAMACSTLGDGPYGFSLVFSLIRSGSLGCSPGT
ncbi:Uncharacterised protein [Bordetella pertussis]|nr:Uncharacterised protein [Bordetella pertussis]